MNISEHLKKPYWKRRIVGDKPVDLPSDSTYFYEDKQDLSAPTQNLTEEDLLREIEPTAHNINSQYQSTRAIKQPVEKRDANGEIMRDAHGNPIREWKIIGYDDLETVRYGLQKRIATVKRSHFAADGFWIGQEGSNITQKQHNDFDTLNSWKDRADLDTALMEITENFECGDSAIFLYITPDNEIDYKVYDFKKGYRIFPDIDENRNPRYFVLYTIRGKRAVDIHTVDGVSTWIEPLDAEIDKSWLAKVKGWFRVNRIEKSEDGWIKVSERQSQIGQGLMQFFYFRMPDIPSGVVQLDIEGIERSASFVAEGVKNTTFDTLFIKATQIENLPAIGSHGAVIGVKGDVDELKAADAKRLAPSDISNVATIDYKNKLNSILHSTMSVIVEPDILRSGADSSSAMRLCFVSEIQWCQTMWPYFSHELRSMMRSFKYLVAKVERNPDIAGLKISVGQNIWIPANRGEQVDQTTKMLYAGIISQENARHELDLQYPDDVDMVRKEAEEKLYREAYVPLKAKAQAAKDFGTTDVANDVIVTDNNNQPQQGSNIDNNAPYRNMATDA